MVLWIVGLTVGGEDMGMWVIGSHQVFVGQIVVEGIFFLHLLVCI